MALKFGATLATILSIVSIAGVCRAEPRGVDWVQAVVDLDRYARTGSDRPVNATKPQAPRLATPTEDPNPQSMGNAWFGVAPRMTLVARDWASSTRLWGDKLSLVDAMRLSASTRMVVGRVRLGNGRFTPFAQAGAGQWRVDRTFLPLTPRTIELATQFGGGFELKVTKKWQLAFETSAINLVRDEATAGVPEAMLWSTFLASRLEF